MRMRRGCATQQGGCSESAQGQRRLISIMMRITAGRLEKVEWHSRWHYAPRIGHAIRGGVIWVRVLGAFSALASTRVVQ